MAEQAAEKKNVSNASGPGGGVEPPPWVDKVSIEFSANPPEVDLDEATSLNWSVSLPGGQPLQVRLLGNIVPMSGSRPVSPSRRTTFTLFVSGQGATVTRTATVSVRYESRVVITPSTRNPADVLVGALTESTHSEQTVEFCVDIDMTGFKSILIHQSNRSLVASAGCERGPRRRGPRIFVTDARSSEALFIFRGDNIKVSGFRLQGPTKGIGEGDRTERGIQIWPLENIAITKVEISNMEIFHWSGAGVQVEDNDLVPPPGKLFKETPDAVRIVGCFFHENQHNQGNGYGVSVDDGAYATIEQNVFDENRHAIKGGSRKQGKSDFSGYVVRDNLILAKGGKHCIDRRSTAATTAGILTGIGSFILGGLLGGAGGAAVGVLGLGLAFGIGWLLGFVCWHTHQIDMHGDGNRWYSKHNWQCGKAGEMLLIERNTILYTAGKAIKIRGNPTDKAVVDGNVFKHDTGAAIRQNGACGFLNNVTNPIDVRNNDFGVDPFTALGRGDFAGAGDGREDEFLATGVTWWAKSPETGQWRFLNTMPERLSQILLQRTDLDLVCDVVLRPERRDAEPTLYSKGGTTPWIPIPIVVGGTPDTPVVG